MRTGRDTEGKLHFTMMATYERDRGRIPNIVAKTVPHRKWVAQCAGDDIMIWMRCHSGDEDEAGDGDEEIRGGQKKTR